MKYLNIPANENFLETLYKYILEEFNYNPIELSDLVVLLPSRRSCNELKKIFLNNSDKKAVLLPNIKAIGDISYDELLLEKIDLNILKQFKEIAKPISNIKYKLLMIKQLLDFRKNLNVEQAVNLSKELNKFLNEVNSNNLDFDNLKNLVDDEYAEHWQKSLDLLQVFGKKWRNYINENNIISNAEYMYKMLDLHTNIYKNRAPKSPILIAGNICNIKKTLELVKALSRYDNTYFVFKGFENVLNNDEFSKINEYHSHFCYLNIVNELKINIKDIKTIENDKIVDNVSRETIYNSFLPADLTYKWHCLDVKSDLTHIKCVECNDEYEELETTTCYILDYIHNHGMKNIAIITDVDTSRFIENSLKKWNIPYQNTFGNKLIFNELIQFLMLILDTYINDFDIDYLLGLLKNKYTLLGYKDKEELNSILSIFEKNILRGKLNNNGLKSYQKNIENLSEGDEKNKLIDFINRIKNIFSDFSSFNLKEIFENHLDIAIKISSNNDVSRETFFTKAFLDNVNNAKVQDILKEFYDNIVDIHLQGIEDYCAIFNYIISELSYTQDYSEDNVVNIISMQEARLINYDLIVINNMIDGNLPKNIPSDPWMSNGMREKFGLPKKEINVGISNFEFIQYLNQKEVLLTYAKKQNNQPTIKSRFLLRLETYLQLYNKNLIDANDFVECVRFLNKSEEKVCIKRPNPIISMNLRPKRLSATNVNNLLLKNPYDIYCKYVLELYPDEDINILQNNIVFGNCVHKIIEEYCKEYNNIQADKFEFLQKLGMKLFKEYFFDNDTSILLFFDRFLKIAKDFLVKDEELRKNTYNIITESEGEFNLKNYTFYARADRIEEGENVNILDYKTGTPPKPIEVKTGKQIQLSIEALILKNNGFKEIKKTNIGVLQYWDLKKDNLITIKEEDIDELLRNTEQMLNNIIDYFNDIKTGYKATLKNQDRSNYLHLSRCNEWLFNE